MKKELPYFVIGNAFGGNQAWFKDPWMHLGGCGALTACDAFICLAQTKGMQDLCTFDTNEITKKKYKDFGMTMKLYLPPRQYGIKEISMWIEGAKAYLDDLKEEDKSDYGLTLHGIEGTEDYETAREAIRESIDNGFPVAYLMLKHNNSRFNFFEWHWFLVYGYEEDTDNDIFEICVATYGNAHVLNLKDLWNTGQDEKGGIVLIKQ